MGFLSSIISSAVKVAISPVAIVKDVIDTATGNEPNNTRELLKSAEGDVDDAIDTITGNN